MNCSELTEGSGKGCSPDFEPRKVIMTYNFNRQKEIDFAVKEERYEDAAILRDGGYVEKTSPGTIVIGEVTQIAKF